MNPLLVLVAAGLCPRPYLGFTRCSRMAGRFSVGTILLLLNPLSPILCKPKNIDGGAHKLRFILNFKCDEEFRCFNERSPKPRFRILFHICRDCLTLAQRHVPNVSRTIARTIETSSQSKSEFTLHRLTLKTSK